MGRGRWLIQGKGPLSGGTIGGAPGYVDSGVMTWMSGHIPGERPAVDDGSWKLGLPHSRGALSRKAAVRAPTNWGSSNYLRHGGAAKHLIVTSRRWSGVVPPAGTAGPRTGSGVCRAGMRPPCEKPTRGPHLVGGRQAGKRQGSPKGEDYRPFDRRRCQSTLWVWFRAMQRNDREIEPAPLGTSLFPAPPADPETAASRILLRDGPLPPHG